AGGDVDQPVPEYRPRHIRESIRVADAPDLLARLWIVRRRAVRADADDFVPIADADDEWRRVRLIRRIAPRRLPPHLARRFVERDDERLVAAVAAQDQQVAVHDRRAAVA